MQSMQTVRPNDSGDGSTGTWGWLRLVLAVLLLLPALQCYGQFESASVLGYVRDTTSAAIPNSKVTLTNVATGIQQTATTDAEGRYEFSSVQIGSYKVVGEAQGFQQTQTQAFTVTTNARQRVDLALRLDLVETLFDGDIVMRGIHGHFHRVALHALADLADLVRIGG